MILSALDIMKEWEDGFLLISPFKQENVNPNSYDLSLGHWFARIGISAVTGAITYTILQANAGDLVVIPTNSVMLVTTMERFGGVSHIVPQIFGKSTMARMGIEVAASAGLGDVGYFDYWTTTVRASVLGTCMAVGEKFAQAVFHHTRPVPDKMIYNGQYRAEEFPIAMVPKEARESIASIQHLDGGRIVWHGDRVSGYKYVEPVIREMDQGTIIKF